VPLIDVEVFRSDRSYDDAIAEGKARGYTIVRTENEHDDNWYNETHYVVEMERTEEDRKTFEDRERRLRLCETCGAYRLKRDPFLRKMLCPKYGEPKWGPDYQKEIPGGGWMLAHEALCEGYKSERQVYEEEHTHVLYDCDVCRVMYPEFACKNLRTVYQREDGQLRNNYIPKDWVEKYETCINFQSHDAEV
jgi:hypothetical protein